MFNLFKDEPCLDFINYKFLIKQLEDCYNTKIRFFVDKKTGEVFEVELLKQSNSKFFIYLIEKDKILGLSLEQYTEFVFDEKIDALMKANKIKSFNTK